MLRKLCVLFLSVFCLAGLIFPAAAQNNTYTSSDGRVTLTYPNGWVVTENRGTITVLTARDMTLSDNVPLSAGQAAFSLHVFSQGSFSPLNNALRGTTPLDRLQSFLDGIQSSAAMSAAEDTTVGSHPAAQSTGEYTASHNQIKLVVVDFENGGYALIVIVTAPGDLDRLQPKMDAIATSVAYTPPPGASGTPVNISGLVPINQTSAANLKRLSVIAAHNGSVRTVAISPDVTTIASGGDDGAILLWDTASGQAKTSPGAQGAGIQQLLFTPDGKRLISASDDGTVRLWDATTAKQVQMQQKDGGIFYMAVSPDSQQIAFSSYVRSPSGELSSTIWLWDLQADSTQMVEAMPSNFLANSLSFSPDGKQLLYCASDGSRLSAGLYDVSSVAATAHWTGRGSPIDVFFTGDSTPLVSIAGGTQDGDVVIWNPQTDNFEFTLTGHQHTVYQTILNSARTIIGTPSLDGTARLWDIQTGDMLGVLTHRASVLGIAFSSDDRLLVTSDSNGFVYLWGIVANI